MDFFRETCAFSSVGIPPAFFAWSSGFTGLPARRRRCQTLAGTGLLCDSKMNPMLELQPDLLRGDDFRCCHAARAEEEAQVPRAALAATKGPQQQG
jgi:hypothetical protein